MSTSITDWFPIENKSKIENRTINYKYFYLNWYYKYPIINWSNSLPEKFNFSKKVYLKDNNYRYHVYLYGYLDTSQDKAFSDLDNISKTSKYREFSNVSLLKSTIQKSIRRQDISLAIKSSFHLMRLNLLEFLRRIVIIAVEDSCLHNDLSIFVWFMMASGEVEIKKKYIRYFLGIVYFLTISNHFDRGLKINLDENNKFLDKIKNNLIENKTLLVSLYIRKLYGGMKGDILMINKLCEIWSSRLIEYPEPKRFSVKIKPIKINQHLTLEEIPNHCVDFHCFPGIIDYLKKKTKYSPENIKKAIWIHSSGINTRFHDSKTKNEFYLDIWRNIQKDFYLKTQYLKMNCY